MPPATQCSQAKDLPVQRQTATTTPNLLCLLHTERHCNMGILHKLAILRDSRRLAARWLEAPNPFSSRSSGRIQKQTREDFPWQIQGHPSSAHLDRQGKKGEHLARKGMEPQERRGGACQALAGRKNKEESQLRSGQIKGGRKHLTKEGGALLLAPEKLAP